LKALAERYAGALVDVALENKQADQVKLELAAFAAMVRESSDLHAFLSNPSIARASKHAAIEELVARMGASRTLRNYLFVIVRSAARRNASGNRAGVSALLDARQGIAQASVTSAGGIDGQKSARDGRCACEAHREKSSSAIQNGSGAHRRRSGEIGSTIYDGSVRAHLDRLRARMISE